MSYELYDAGFPKAVVGHRWTAIERRMKIEKLLRNMYVIRKRNEK